MAQSLPKNPKILDISSPELSIIIPMRNEAENVAPLIKEIYAELSKKTDFEIVCIDDGNDDTTEFELRQIKITCTPVYALFNIIIAVARAPRSAQA